MSRRGGVNLGVGQNESTRIAERKHEAVASVRLVNKDGDVIWSTTQESLGAKFRGRNQLGSRTWSLDRQPFPFETSLPHAFAVGDVRHGSIKRVASAVGEGSAVVSFVLESRREGRPGHPVL